MNYLNICLVLLISLAFLLYFGAILLMASSENCTIREAFRRVNRDMFVDFLAMIGPDPLPAYRADEILLIKLCQALAPYNALPVENMTWSHISYSIFNLPAVALEFISKPDIDFSVVRAVLQNTFCAHMQNCGIAEFRCWITREALEPPRAVVIIVYATTAQEMEKFGEFMISQKNAALANAAKSVKPLIDNVLEHDLANPDAAISSPNFKMILGADLQHNNAAVSLDVTKTGHFCIVGGTGSGKSMFVLYALYWILKIGLHVHLFIGDFKKSGDYSGISDDFAEFDGLPDLIDRFYREFEETPEGNETVKILLIDEYAGFITWLTQKDKKLAEEIKGKIANLLMLGRSRRCFVWCIQQRITATLFPSGIGAIDNFQVCVGLGRLSPDSRRSLFAGEDFDDVEFAEHFTPGTGTGLCLVDGQPLRALAVPYIRDKTALCAAIRRLAQNR